MAGKSLAKSKGRRLCLALGLVLGLSLALLCIRAGLAETLDPTAYTARQAGRYFSLPRSGPNFSTYSLLWHAVGRCYLKGATGMTVLDAYRELADSLPDRHFVYAETGRNGGGPFWPHRTHREGLSVDFITPVLRRTPQGAEPGTLSCMPWNLWGYTTRLDAADLQPSAGGPEAQPGAQPAIQLDAAALIAHLSALNKAAPRYGLRIKLIILDPPLQALLRQSPGYAAVADLPFMGKPAWVPHDGHYHVDFAPR